MFDTKQQSKKKKQKKKKKKNGMRIKTKNATTQFNVFFAKISICQKFQEVSTTCHIQIPIFRVHHCDFWIKK